MEKRKGATFEQASSNSIQLVQIDNKIYGITLENGIPQSIEDLTESLLGNA